MSSRRRTFPTRLDILGEQWRVRYSPGLADDGRTDGDAQTIYISADLSYERQRSVFLHECIHACEAVVHVSPDDVDDSEHYVGPIAAALADLLTRNRLWNF